MKKISEFLSETLFLVVKFSIYLNRHVFVMGRQIVCHFACLPVHQTPSEKGSTLKGKELLPLGASSFFLKKINLFQMGGKNKCIHPRFS